MYRNTILTVTLLLLVLPELALLAHIGQPVTISRPETTIRNDALSSDVATLVGTVNVAALPTPSSSLNSQFASTPNLSLSESPVVPQNAPTTPVGFSVFDVQPGSSFVHIQKSIAGTPGTNPNPCICTPPDMGIAASSKFVVQMVNLAGTIYRTDGGTVSTFALSDFWFLPTRGGPLNFGMSDPDVVFDARAGRFFASIIDTFDVNRVRIAVTATDDPTAVWFIYAVRTPTSTTLPDQPLIGFSDDKFLVSANDFTFDSTFSTATYIGVQYWILNSAEMFAGNRFIDTTTNTPIGPPASNDFRVTPAVTLSSTTTAYMAENCITLVTVPLLAAAVATNTCSSAPPGDGGIVLFTVTGTPTSTTMATVTRTTVPIQPIGFPRNADQPGNPASLNSRNLARLTNAVWQNNLLWTALNDGNNGGPPGTTCPVAVCVRLDEISTATTTLLQDFDLTTQRAATFYGAVSLDSSNNLVVLYGTSSLSVFPTLQVVGQTTTMTAATVSLSRTLASGTAPDLSQRFGDYFNAAIQPNVPSTFWVSGEYRQISLGQGWSTQVGEVTFQSF